MVEVRRNPEWVSPFEPVEVPTVGRQGRKAKYPWDQWLDSEWHTAEHGKDFTCSLGSFRSYLYNYALGHHLLVRVEVVSKVDRIVRFCFWSLDDDAYDQ